MNQEELKSLLTYDPITGDFIWLVKPATWIVVGSKAGHVAANGYIQIRLKGKLYYAHRLAFLYMTGMFPLMQVDHINGDTSDTRWHNLREVTSTQNNRNSAISKNNTSGVLGVIWEKRRQKWRAVITVNRVNIFLGYFTELSLAATARKEAEALYGFHSNHGRIHT